MAEWFLGTMGFGYKDWGGGIFYPADLRSQNYLNYYSRSFNAVELDTTFYGTPPPKKVRQWAASVPDRFVFCAKLPRAITHEKALVGVQGDLIEFVDAMRELGARLGALLIQFPPSFTLAEEKRLADFLELLPGDIIFAVEFRHPSWANQRILDLLSSHGVCWATTEFPGLPNEVRQTADFLYIRWIGQHGTYDRHTHERVDKTQQLAWWKDQLQPYLEQVRAIYGFFNNDYAGYAAGTCKRMQKLLGIAGDSQELVQGKLF